jgi:hypothetical protein
MRQTNAAAGIVGTELAIGSELHGALLARVIYRLLGSLEVNIDHRSIVSRGFNFREEIGYNLISCHNRNVHYIFYNNLSRNTVRID